MQIVCEEVAVELAYSFQPSCILSARTVFLFCFTFESVPLVTRVATDWLFICDAVRHFDAGKEETRNVRLLLRSKRRSDGTYNYHLYPAW